MQLSWRGALHVWRRSYVLYRRTWLTNLLPNFFEAPVMLLGFGVGLGSYIGTTMGGVDYLSFLVPGLVVANAMNGAAFETTYNIFVRMHFSRTYEAIITTPVNLEDAMLGELLWAATRGTLYGMMFALMTLPFGVLDLSDLAAVFLPVALTAWLFAAVGLAFTSFIRVIDLYSFFYTLFVTPMFLFSGIFFPLEDLPAWFTRAAWFTPLYHCVRLGKAAVHGGWGWPHAVSVVWILVASVLFSALGIARIKRTLVR